MDLMVRRRCVICGMFCFFVEWIVCYSSHTMFACFFIIILIAKLMTVLYGIQNDMLISECSITEKVWTESMKKRLDHLFCLSVFINGESFCHEWTFYLMLSALSQMLLQKLCPCCRPKEHLPSSIFEI